MGILDTIEAGANNLVMGTGSLVGSAVEALGGPADNAQNRANQAFSQGIGPTSSSTPAQQFKYGMNLAKTEQEAAQRVNAVIAKTAAEDSLNSPPLIFPPDLGSNAVGTAHPFMSFQFIEYRSRWALLERSGKNTAKIQDQAAEKKLKQAIYLPLPQELSATAAPVWEMQDSRLLAGALSHNTFGSLEGLSDTIGGIMANMAINMIPDIAKQAAGGAFGLAINPKKQMFFQGIDARDFSFSWTLSPKSSDEADKIQDIIYKFTSCALPGLADGPNSTYFDFPYECIITFHNTKGFPQFSESLVCTGVQTSYAPGGMQLLADDHAAHIHLALSFKETTIRSQQDPGVEGRNQ